MLMGLTGARLTFRTLGCWFPILRLMSMNPSYVCETYKTRRPKTTSINLAGPHKTNLFLPHAAPRTHALAPLTDDDTNQTTPKEGVCKGDHPIPDQHAVDLFLALGGMRQASHARRVRVFAALSGPFRLTLTRTEMTRRGRVGDRGRGGRRRLEDLDKVFFFHRHRVKEMTQ
jgi:hypothetical protein